MTGSPAKVKRVRPLVPYDLEPTKFGFRWGPATIVRVADDAKFGVVLWVETPRQRMEFRVTPSGLIRTAKVQLIPRRKKP